MVRRAQARSAGQPPWVLVLSPNIHSPPTPSEPGGPMLDWQLEGMRPELSGLPCVLCLLRRGKKEGSSWCPLQFNLKPSRSAGGQVAQGLGPVSVVSLGSQRVCALCLSSHSSLLSLSLLHSFAPSPPFFLLSPPPSLFSVPLPPPLLPVSHSPAQESDPRQYLGSLRPCLIEP